MPPQGLHKSHRPLTAVTLFVIAAVAAGCGGGSDGASGGGGSPFTESACSYTSGDSTQNNDGSASWVPSHTEGASTYHTIGQVRQKQDGADVGIDYMVHAPNGTPKGVVVLIAGGPLNAGIEGTGDGGTVTASRGNFLVRSAHRFASRGYRAITIDRPDDYADYGNIDSYSYLYDAYRNSMAHAVDLATVIRRENAENFDVVIAGTSRGAISAAANNALVAGVALSSPVTRSSSGGSPVGSANLPVSAIQRPAHILIHQNDGCWATTPQSSRTLFSDLRDAGVEVAGDEVSGGFRDTVRDNPCKAFDYHGFTGIEMCAVTKTTDWSDALLSSLSANEPPRGTNQTLTVAAGSSGNSVTLAASDDDMDTLSFSLPYTNTPLGGSVTTTADGSASYEAPAGISGTTDRFVFVVEDDKGGVGFGVVTVNLN